MKKTVIFTMLTTMLLSTAAFAGSFYDKARWSGKGQWHLIGPTGIVASGVSKITWEACGKLVGGYDHTELVGLTTFSGMYKFSVAEPQKEGEEKVNPFAPGVGEPVNPAATDVFWLVDNNTEKNYIKTGGQLVTNTSYISKVVQQGVVSEESGYIEGGKYMRNGRITLADGSVLIFYATLYKQLFTSKICKQL